MSAIASFLFLVSITPSVADDVRGPSPAPGNSGASAPANDGNSSSNGVTGNNPGNANGSDGAQSGSQRGYGVRGYSITRASYSRSVAGFQATRDSYRFQIDGKEYTLEGSLKYNNPNGALAKFKATHAESINKIRAYFKLPELTEKTASLYVEKISFRIMGRDTPISSEELFTVADFASTLTGAADNAKTEQMVPKLVQATKARNSKAIIEAQKVLDGTIPAASKHNVNLTKKLDAITAPTNPNGANGANGYGANGADGSNGANGANGANGVGANGADGSNGANGANGADGNNGANTNGANGSNTNGAEGNNGANTNGANGSNTNGADGNNGANTNGANTNDANTNGGQAKPATVAPKKINIPNVEAAVQYAKKYAYTPNTEKYQYFEHADCTNFASQILAAGGQPTDAYWHPYPWGDATRHTYSWAVANAFARHWGLNQATTSWTEFANRVHRGSFVALAYSNGKVYHTAFVTEKGGTVTDEYGTYNTFAVAQHTRNYEGWVHGGGEGATWRDRGYWITAEGDTGQ